MRVVDVSENGSWMVSSGGAQLFVRERGRARAPVVLLVHGYPDTHSVWDELAEQLAERFRVVAYDTRGMGRSTAPAETRAFALAQLARDLEAVIESIPGDEWVHLVGHDWGAFAAWEAVSAPAPDPRIASLTAVAGPRIDLAPMWVRSRLRPSPVALGQLFSQARRSWYIAAFQLPVLPERIVATAFERSWPAVMRRLERIQPRAGHPAPTLVHDARTGLALYRANFATFAGRRRRARPQLPVQLVVATRDRYVSPALYAEAASWGRDVWRRDVRAGHWVQRSHPALLARYVTDLIEHAEGEGDSRPLRRARLSEHSARGALAGRLAVVTGAGSGIGRATALALVAQGAEVIAVDIDGQAAGETAVLAGGDEVARAAEVDVADAAAMERFAGLVAERDGVPQIVVNNAGIGVAGPFLEMAVADWERIVDVNLWGDPRREAVRPADGRRRRGRPDRQRCVGRCVHPVADALRICDDQGGRADAQRVPARGARRPWDRRHRDLSRRCRHEHRPHGPDRRRLGAGAGAAAGAQHEGVRPARLLGRPRPRLDRPGGAPKRGGRAGHARGRAAVEDVPADAVAAQAVGEDRSPYNAVSSRRLSFPVAVRGSSDTNSISRGTLYRASLPLT